MSGIKFVKEPGHTYTVLDVFKMYFNKSFYQKEPLGYQYAMEDREYFEKVLEPYLPIPDDLLLFFYMLDSNVTFMVSNYFLPYKEDFFNSTYNLSVIQSALTQHDDVVSKIYKFYFQGISEDKITECKASVQKMNELVKNSQYSDTVKSALYSFLLDPVPIIQKLSYELMAKDFMLNQECEKNIKAITQLQGEFDYEEIKTQLGQIVESDVDLNNYDECYISISLNLRQVISVQYHEHKMLMIVGLDYFRYLDYLLNKNSVTELDYFGDIISEINRLKVLELIYQRREITIKDIETELGLTGTNAYYHIAMMLKAGMLKTRNRGRTILYSINKVYFATISEAFKKFAL